VLVILGLTYGNDRSLAVAADLMRLISHAAYRASTALAREKGSFPHYERDKYLLGPFVCTLPEDVRDGIAIHGIRNSHLIAIAPTGTISLLAGNVSSGLEPIFAASYSRKVLTEDGRPSRHLSSRMRRMSRGLVTETSQTSSAPGGTWFQGRRIAHCTEHGRWLET